MKHFILFLFFLLSSVSANSQSYTLTWQGEELEEEITVYGQVFDDELLFYANLTNNSDDTDTIKVKRVFVDFEPGATHLLCWQNCYPANYDSVFVSPLHVILEAGETCADLTFSGHYRPNGILGTSTVLYTFFDTNDKEENISVLVHYSTATTSTLDEDLHTNLQLNLYPNPSKNVVFVESKSPFERVQLFHINGQILVDKEVTDTRVELDTSMYDAGVYIVRILDSKMETRTELLMIE